MIHDRLVVGLRDTNLSLKLQMDPKLTLKTAVTTASQGEMVRKQQSVIRPVDQPPSIDRVVSRGSIHKRASHHNQLNPQNPRHVLDVENHWHIPAKSVQP